VKVQRERERENTTENTIIRAFSLSLSLSVCVLLLLLSSLCFRAFFPSLFLQERGGKKNEERTKKERVFAFA
jgi:hypothetical protein